MKKARKVFSILLVAVLVGSLGFTFFAVADTFSKLNTSVASHISDATLASADVSTQPTATFAVTYWQQISDPCTNPYDLSTKNTIRQFEWQNCNYYNDAIETGIVKTKLGEDFLPIPSYDSLADAKFAGAHLTNRNIYGENFARWFHAVDGISTEQNSTLKLNYSADDDIYTFEDANFHPTGESLFTMQLAIPFHATENSNFSITADDDTWVFLNDTLVIDLGGIHGPTTASADIPEDGILYVFHADRDSADSVFKLQLSHCTFSTSDTTLAYDDSSYVAPLGESTASTPDHKDAILNTITIEFSILGLLIFFTPFVVRIIMRH